MKEASITLKLTKDHEVHKHKVTPIEAMLLVAEHHVAAGGCPVMVIKDTIKDCHHIAEETIEVDEDKVVTDEKGVKKIVTTKVKQTRKVEKPYARTVDEELDRLRGKYHNSKVDRLSAQVRDFPVDDFDKALERGIKLTVSATKSFVSETKV